MSLTRLLAIIAITLWGVTAAVFAALQFQSGPQMHAADRDLIAVSADERKFVLKEMRLMLESLQGIMMALEVGDNEALAEAAAGSGNVMLAALPPSLMAKAPKDFRVMAKGAHQGYARIEAAARKGEGKDKIISLLAEVLGECTACHDSYRFIDQP
ncbi:MAG: hypothetical protein C0605_12815 [Hyphomicrobiales bacterium]|nr:MAG: hypothetical protein C0605_12815 [Hyphomicrobiales bacterium]